jgi:hypothetical protein
VGKKWHGARIVLTVLSQEPVTTRFFSGTNFTLLSVADEEIWHERGDCDQKWT